MLILRRFLTAMLALFLPAMKATAEYPLENLGGHKQLDGAKLEKNLRVEFDQIFPEHRYDIDYFYQGDLAAMVIGKQELMVTFPISLGDSLAFAVGTGKDDTSYRAAFEVNVEFDQAGEILGCSIIWQQEANWPSAAKQRESIFSGDPKPWKERRGILAVQWRKWANQTSNPKSAVAMITAAIRVIDACQPLLVEGRMEP